MVMNDARYYQKKRQSELGNPTGFEGMNSTFNILLGAVVGCIVLMVLLLVIVAKSSEDSRNNCEKIGGEYIVVDKQFAGKTIVNVYGCVK